MLFYQININKILYLQRVVISPEKTQTLCFIHTKNISQRDRYANFKETQLLSLMVLIFSSKLFYQKTLGVMSKYKNLSLQHLSQTSNIIELLMQLSQQNCYLPLTYCFRHPKNICSHLEIEGPFRLREITLENQDTYRLHARMKFVCEECKQYYIELKESEYYDYLDEMHEEPPSQTSEQKDENLTYMTIDEFKDELRQLVEEESPINEKIELLNIKALFGEMRNNFLKRVKNVRQKILYKLANEEARIISVMEMIERKYLNLERNTFMYANERNSTLDYLKELAQNQFLLKTKINMSTNQGLSQLFENIKKYQSMTYTLANRKLPFSQLQYEVNHLIQFSLFCAIDQFIEKIDKPAVPPPPPPPTYKKPEFKLFEQQKKKQKNSFLKSFFKNFNKNLASKVNNSGNKIQPGQPYLDPFQGNINNKSDNSQGWSQYSKNSCYAYKPSSKIQELL